MLSSAVHHAVASENLSALKLLLDAGASAAIKNTDVCRMSHTIIHTLTHLIDHRRVRRQSSTTITLMLQARQASVD